MCEICVDCCATHDEGSSKIRRQIVERAGLQQPREDRENEETGDSCAAVYHEAA